MIQKMIQRMIQKMTIKDDDFIFFKFIFDKIIKLFLNSYLLSDIIVMYPHCISLRYHKCLHIILIMMPFFYLILECYAKYLPYSNICFYKCFKCSSKDTKSKNTETSVQIQNTKTKKETKEHGYSNTSTRR